MGYTEEQQILAFGVVSFLTMEGVHFTPETVVELLFENSYQDIFYWGSKDSLECQDLEKLRKFIKDIHILETEKIFIDLEKKGICVQGVNSFGEIGYLPLKGTTEQQLSKMVLERLQKL